MTTEQNELLDQIIEKDKKINELYADIRKLQASEDEARRKNIRWEQHSEEVGEQNRSRLMSVFFLLDRLAEVGTHHEKEVVIRFLKLTIEGFVNRSSTLRFPEDHEYPF